MDDYKNLAVSAVAVAPSPPTSGTSLTITAGHGITRLPAVPFNATIWPSGQMPTPDNAEIVRVTAKASDVLTFTREQEGTAARAIQAGDLFAAAITEKLVNEIVTGPSSSQADSVVAWNGTTGRVLATTGITVVSGSALTVPGGLGATPLNASFLSSGTLPDARLSANVQMKPIAAGDLPVHATRHQSGGADVVDVKLLGGYPGGTANFLRADGTFAAPPAGIGDVVGPASSTATAVARYADATGKLLLNSGVLIDAGNNITGVASITTPLVQAPVYALADGTARMSLTTTLWQVAINGPTNWRYLSFTPTGLFPDANNLHSLGLATNQWSTVYAATSVVTPLIAASDGACAVTLSGPLFQVAVGGPTWRYLTFTSTGLHPEHDNTHTLGESGKRWSTIHGVNMLLQDEARVGYVTATSHVESKILNLWGTTPYIYFKETGAPADQKNWVIYATGSQWTFNLATDNLATQPIAMAFYRSGATPTGCYLVGPLGVGMVPLTGTSTPVQLSDIVATYPKTIGSSGYAMNLLRYPDGSWRPIVTGFGWTVRANLAANTLLINSCPSTTAGAVATITEVAAFFEGGGMRMKAASSGVTMTLWGRVSDNVNTLQFATSAGSIHTEVYSVSTLFQIAINGPSWKYFLFTPTAFHPWDSNTHSLGLAGNRWSTLYAVNAIVDTMTVNGTLTYGSISYTNLTITGALILPDASGGATNCSIRSSSRADCGIFFHSTTDIEIVSNGSAGIGAKTSMSFGNAAGQRNVLIQANRLIPYPSSSGGVGVGLGETNNRWTGLWAENGTIQTSDARLKVLTPNPFGLDFIRKIETVGYRWRANPVEQHYGVTAQQLETLGFDAIHRPSGESDSAYMLNYSELIAPMIRAIQELDERMTRAESQPQR